MTTDVVVTISIEHDGELSLSSECKKVIASHNSKVIAETDCLAIAPAFEALGLKVAKYLLGVESL